MSPALALVMCALTATPAPKTTLPGTLITIQATCQPNASGTGNSASAVTYLVVKSPLCSLLPGPVYIANGWKSGAVLNASGLRVKFLHISNRGELKTLEGIQIRDGRVLVSGIPIERNMDAK
ncbi:MAG: hypothetical protein ABFD54_18150 [Armatimonadota bacterium]